MSADNEQSGTGQPVIVGPTKPMAKASYESSVDVQRWLQEQAAESSEHKPEFDPSFLSGLRDRLWILSSLTHFYEQDLISDVLHVVKSGKEATVYCCVAERSTGTEYLAAKVYRPRMFRSLSNDVLYRTGRVQRDERGKVVRDRRHQRGAVKKTERWRADKVNSWIEYEYKTQRLVYEAGGDVPRPLSQVGNAVLMEYIGAVGEPAPLLREIRLPRDEAQAVFERVLRNIALFLSCDRIHGDLSAYNILYWQGTPVIIDFAQAVDPRHDPDLLVLLARDVDRVCRYFARCGVVADAGAITAELWERYQEGGL